MNEPDHPPASKYRRSVWAIALLVPALAVSAWLIYGPRRTPVGQPPLVRLTAQSLGQLADRFNAHSDEARVLVMLSPT
jgi:hypothetical protein